MKTFLHFTLALLIGGIFTSVNADIITIEPSDDMYSDPDHPPGHPVAELWVANYPPMSHHQRIMMKFDLSQFNDETINSATLNLNRFFGCPSGEPTNTNVYDITEDWNESTWLENQHISHGTTVWSNYIFTVNGWHCIDITTLVQAWVDNSIDNYGLVIEALANNKFTKCYSKEASSPSLRPYLEIDYEASDVTARDTELVSYYTLGAYPNPFNPTTNLTFNLAEPGEITLIVYDLMGREVAKLVEGWYVSGVHQAAFDGADLSSGVYIARLQSARYTETTKLLLLK